MSLLSGVAAATGAVGALDDIVDSLFPDQILIDIPDQEIQINIDAVLNSSVSTDIQISEHPTENKETLVQNISPTPRQITLTCILSSIIRLSNAKTLQSAAQLGIAAALPEVGQLTNIIDNEEDSIVIRLQKLRTAQELGQLITIVGLPEQDDFEFIITNITDNETVETGPKGRAVDITIRESFIIDSGLLDKSIISPNSESIPGTPVNTPTGLGGVLA